MAKGEIVITQEFCKGCGYCVKFCSRGCIELSTEKLNAWGFYPAVFVQTDRCNACGVCAWMCPSLAIETYKYVQ